MRLGIHLPFKGPDGEVRDAQGVMADARAIEAAGFDGVWLGDGIGAMPRPDPLSWLLVAAAATKTLEVGTSILQVPIRNPVELAQRLITLHTLTQGRFSAGVGAGSGDKGYLAVGGDFEKRFHKLREDLSVIRALCNGERVGDADLCVWPSARGGPPIIIGAWFSDLWLRKAAQEYDGWMCSGSFHRSKERGHETSFRSLAESLQKYRYLGGRRAMIASVMVDLEQPESSLGESEPFNLRCGPRSAAARLSRLEDMGWDDVLLVTTQPGRLLYEAHPSAEELAALRSLVKRDPRPLSSRQAAGNIPAR